MIRRNPLRALALPAFLLLGALALGAADDPKEILISAQIFRIRGNISGDTTLADNIWTGKAPQSEEGKAMTFFTGGKLRAAGHLLEVTESGWRWDGKPLDLSGGLPATDPNVMTLAAPRIAALMGQNAVIEIGSTQGMEYFAARGGSLYELKKSEEPTGLSLALTPQPGRDGRIRLAGLTLTTRMVEKRKPLAGTTLNVGEPEVTSRTLTADVQLKPGKDYGFFFFTNDGQGTLLVRLRAAPAKKD